MIWTLIQITTILAIRAQYKHEDSVGKFISKDIQEKHGGRKLRCTFRLLESKPQLLAISSQFR